MLTSEVKALAIEALEYRKRKIIESASFTPEEAEGELAEWNTAIAAINAEAEWELLPDGVYDALCVDCNGSDIGIYIGDDPDGERTISDYEWLSDAQDKGLPGHIRLFARTTTTT
jgi:hypothetical protein